MRIPKAVYWGGSAVAAGVAAYAIKTQIDGWRARPKRSPYPLAREPLGRSLEVVHEFEADPMPAGVAVSRDGRVFVSHPRWAGSVEFTLAELRDGVEVPFPESDDASSVEPLLSVESVVVDDEDRLWALDAGGVAADRLADPRLAKLVAIDLESGRVVRVIRFPPHVALESTWLKDLRLDRRRGAGGMAFVSDASADGANAIVVVDLASGRSWRKLHGHRAVKADALFLATVEGRPALVSTPGELLKPTTFGVDAMAIDPLHDRLWFAALASRTLYSVALDALADEAMPDVEVARTLWREQRRFASDGIEADAEGNLYLGDWEHNAVIVRRPGGAYETLVSDARMWWPDKLALSRDGWLYFTANQQHRLPAFNRGKDLRHGPTYLFRVRCGGSALNLGAAADDERGWRVQ